MSGEARPLASQGVLDDLDEKFLTFLQEIGNGHFILFLVHVVDLAFRHQDICHVQESGPLQADIDEGRLHPRKDAADRALVDVADQTALLGALDVDLLQQAVLDDGHPRLAGRHIYQNLVTHRSFPNLSCILAVHESDTADFQELRRLEQGQAHDTRITSLNVAHEHRAQTLDGIAPGLAPGLATAPIGPALGN